MSQLITVIIPVYNVERYIRRCIDSICNQTYREIEIILIDDGSTDDSGKMCDEAALSDPRIRVIHKVNGGLSDARNAGLDVMHGKYVTFVDSDDFVARDYIEKLYRAIISGNADVSICAESYVMLDADANIKTLKRPLRDYDGALLMTAEEALSVMLKQDLYDAAAWAKLYCADLFMEVRYPAGYAYEDIGTTYKLFLKSKKVVYVGEHLYFYLQREGSILHSTNNSKRYWDGIFMVESQRNEIVRDCPQLKKDADCRCLSMYFHALMGADVANDIQLKAIAWEKIKGLRLGVLFHTNGRLKARIASLLSILGKKTFLRIWKLLKK